MKRFATGLAFALLLGLMAAMPGPSHAAGVPVSPQHLTIDVVPNPVP